MVAFLLILLGVLLIVAPVSAATTATILSSPLSATVDTPFDIQASINGEPSTGYYIKGRIGISSSSLTKGLTNNPNNSPPDDWLTDNDSWSKFPTATTNSSGSWDGALKIKASSTATTGDNLLVFRIRKVGVTTNHDSASKAISLSSSTAPSPSATPTPTPTPTPTSTPSSSPARSSSTSSPFTISNVPSQINSDQPFTVQVNLFLPSSPNTNFYLKGAFKKADSSNYFGKTLVSGSWVKNGSTYSNQYSMTTDSQGNWFGTLEIQPDSSDSGFVGTDNYIFKVGRYTQAGSGPSWSNETNIKIISVASEDQGGISTSNKVSSSPNTSALTQQAQASQSKTKVPTSDKSSTKLDYQIATIAAATASAKEATQEAGVKVEKQTNYMMWVGLFMVLSGIAVFTYIYLRSKGLHETIYHLFRKRN